MAAAYVPERGDLIWLECDPQAGHEQAGRRPALVLSTQGYHRRSNLMVCVPITSQVKGYPFEVAVASAQGISGVALADQIKSMDWRTRKAKRAGQAASATVDEVLAKLSVLLQINTPST